MFGFEIVRKKDLEQVKETLLKVKREMDALATENARLRFPTGLKMPADAKVDAMLARPGKGCVEGIEALLLQHVWEQSGEAFHPDNQGETRVYHIGGAAALEQFRVDLKSRLAAEGTGR